MGSDKEFSRVAQNLLMEILRLASDLLPRSHCLQLNVRSCVCRVTSSLFFLMLSGLQSLPQIVASAVSLSADPRIRIRAAHFAAAMRKLALVSEEVYDEFRDSSSSGQSGVDGSESLQLGFSAGEFPLLFILLASELGFDILSSREESLEHQTT